MSRWGKWSGEKRSEPFLNIPLEMRIEFIYVYACITMFDGGEWDEALKLLETATSGDARYQVLAVHHTDVSKFQRNSFRKCEEQRSGYLR